MSTTKPGRVGSSVVVVDTNGDVVRRFLWLESPDDFAREAAPELLAALEALLDRMTDGRGEADAATLEEWSRDARAAIAKARGQ